MKLRRMFLALVLVVGLTGVAYVAQQAEPAGSRMAGAAAKFLAQLTPEQKAKATFAFDDKERVNWHFVPLQDQERQSTRKGVPLEDMSDKQRQAARDLVKAALSAAGYEKAMTIMSLEAILRDLEKKGAMVRKPDWYFFTIFGTPGNSGKWGMRVEGHHLSLNFTLQDGKVTSTTPAMFGANPATVKAGPKKGLRALPEAEDLARELFKALNDEQRKVAHHADQFPEIAGRTNAPKADAPKGLAASKMSEAQRGLLWKLVQSYAQRMPEDVATAELAEVRKAGIENLHFGYAGKPEPGQEHSYRVQGPTFVIEYVNTQKDSAGNPANHIHSAWRNLKGDFGLGQ